MSKSPKKKPADVAADPEVKEVSAESILNQLGLSTIRIVESHSKMNIQNSVIPSHLGVQIGSRVGANEVAKVVLGTVDVTVTVTENDKSDPDDASKSSIKIQLSAQCVFKVEEIPKISQLSKRDAQDFNGMVTFIAWPYIRQHVAAITLAMSIPPITLPILRRSPSGKLTGPIGSTSK
ncbi:hypothetical protein [Planctellipticum variicoloris]|uniref:hypothetical protein n=1 Tax=Planctellipticum variicoloris TaxID=3064265 RepID=UPI003013DDF1|nr:hypothetical protein SH412_000942 [Planctomycetaceae bacterium SH412]